MGLGMPEIAIILVIIIIVFGVKRLPQIGKDIGAGLREFKNAGKELIGGEDEDEDKSDKQTR